MVIMHKKQGGFFGNSPLHRLNGDDIIVEKGGVNLRDFPIFPTDYGVSSLVLKEIPYRKQAYIRIGDVQPRFLREHLEECAKFCRMAGAERIFAAGEGLESYPVYTSVLQMQGQAWVNPEKLCCLFPVTEATVSRWRELHNQAMARVDNAGTLESRDEKKILENPGAYFVHDNGRLLGIGWMEDCKLLAVAAVERGTGEQVMHTLMSLVEGDPLTVEVASTNERAIRLYEKLGLCKTREIICWHDVTALAR